MHGGDARGLRQCAELAPQARDVGVERVVMNDRAIRPARRDELVAPNGFARLREQPSEEPELGRRQLHAGVAGGGPVRDGIEAEPGGLERAVAAASPQQGLEPGDELRKRERLRQVIVAACVEAGKAVGERVPGREEEDRRLDAESAERLAQVAPIGVGHPAKQSIIARIASSLSPDKNWDFQ